jgi:hypothetical protein
VCYWGYKRAKEWSDDAHAIRAFPDDADMDKALQYRKSAQKDFDWALKNLRESQQRRNHSRPPT